MLCRLEISNFALIENVSLNFQHGFSVITGETGAGKSILLKALGLVLGDRADASVLKQNENKCFVEAVFNVESLNLENFFQAHELDFDNTCILRREFNHAGKSRCFVNDTPVQLQVLKDLGEQIVSLHTQHETLSLLNNHFHFEMLDAFAGIQTETLLYQKHFSEYKKRLNDLALLRETDAKNRKEKDYKEFLLNELNAANLQQTNIEKLSDQLMRIQNSEKIAGLLSKITNNLSLDESNIVSQLKQIANWVDELKKLDPSITAITERLEVLRIDLADIAREFDDLSEQSEISEESVQTIKEKMDVFHTLSYKHNVKTVEELILLKDKLEKELSQIENIENSVLQTEKEIEKLYQNLISLAQKISQKREKKISDFCKAIHGVLSDLLMVDAKIQLDLKKAMELNKHGLDELEFLFKTNKGGEFLPLKKIASGGELSRLMLAILSVISASKKLPVLIFDEIDTGVSGEVASRMATEFQRIGKSLQLIVITHLPQVAAKGTMHLHVYKESTANKTHTFVKDLTKDERIEQLARMMSGEKVTKAALENAGNLLNFS
ncbi:MAG: DNA repair protein RecN [Crocinitomicaceae bacterium]|nr:DNA repair protein RecN [Crocinitomicaceae bacterium]MBK8926785.1 DNA repair protein RecN [Crocinitomicaceae bacterium]